MILTLEQFLYLNTTVEPEAYGVLPCYLVATGSTKVRDIPGLMKDEHPVLIWVFEVPEPPRTPYYTATGGIRRYKT